MILLHSIFKLNYCEAHSLQSVTCKGRAERMFRRLPPEKNRLAFKSVQRGAGLFDKISRFSAKIISRNHIIVCLLFSDANLSLATREVV